MAAAIVLERHPIVWRDAPVWPFMWRGLVPLAALVLVALYAFLPFAHGSIQGTVEQQIRAQLEGAGLGWVGVSVSGQSVKLAGVEPAAGDGARALQLAQAAQCPTWLGHHTCATAVEGHFMPPPAEPAPLAAPAPVTPRTTEVPAVPLTRAGCEGSLAELIAREQVEFAPGSARIDAKSGALLDELARAVRACPGRIRIEGHTDTVGRGRLNRRLSEARAAAVRSALIARGIAPGRLTAKGYGARRPIADNTTEAGRARNRRIEFHTVSAK